MRFIAAIRRLIGHGKLEPSGIIVHATSGNSGQSSIEWLAKVGLGYHYVIERDGSIIVGVPRDQVAWHSGVSLGWGGKGCNSYTIGIAFANLDNVIEPIRPEQHEALAALTRELMRKEPALQYISAHKWVSPGRKTDPIRWSPQGTHYEGLRIWRGPG
jgi:N-acetyl-anhydromuramyl-L-alanine amidase AmpD